MNNRRMFLISLRRLALVLSVSLCGFVGTDARAEDSDACRVIDVSFTPTDDLQIVVWVETRSGEYVDTAFITRFTGSLGLGNRPGMMDFNSGYLFPYGRRLSTFPVWADKHGMEWPMVVFQDGDDRDLSHPLRQSSAEPYYCRPIKQTGDPLGHPVDATSCATTVYTDKGTFHPTKKSKYPPRSDVEVASSSDHGDVLTMAGLNPFDGISRATPTGGQNTSYLWSIPRDMPNGEYVVWVEVGKAFDKNAAFDYPSPTDIAWANYGSSYRGQPSIVYRVPITVSDGKTTASSSEYFGYGDPDGLDGRIREPDDLITSGVAGSGAERLLLSSSADGSYRVRVNSEVVDDQTAPGGVGQLEIVNETESSVELSFIESGDDDQIGSVAGYEVRFLVGETISDSNFVDGTPVATGITPREPGAVQSFVLDGLTASTNYSIGVRAFDECLNYGPVIPLQVATSASNGGEVDACFIATAAYGTMMVAEVQVLRDFRDRFLRKTVPGEVLVESYYTFGPGLARLIAPSPVLRRAARTALAEWLEF